MKALGIASLLLLLSACGEPEVIHSTPPPEWSDPVEEPAVPAEVNDDTVGQYIVDLMDALREANNKLLRIKTWQGEINEAPPQSSR